MSFDLSSYSDVAERITAFYERYPEGRLVSVDAPITVTAGGKDFVVLHARAYRTPDDPHPGDGWAWEPVPGPTQFTKDSELMNAQTAAWGRAIVALGFSTKKIASVEEVRARQSPEGGNGSQAAGSPVASSSGMDSGSPSEPFTPPPPKPQPDDGGEPSEVQLTFGAHKGKKLGDLMAGSQKERGYVEWLAGPEFEPQTPTARRVKGAAVTILGGIPEPVGAGNDDADSIPF